MIFTTCLAGLCLGGLASLGEPETAAEGAIDHMVTGAIPTSERFSLHVNGQAASCALERYGDSSMRAVGPQCHDLPHGLADASDWTETADGAVVLAHADGSVLMQFAVSDGAAYESFDPPLPMVLLAAE
ncbi:hypothetical protein GRZ55_08160 [Chelativorans sp. ZYF759]|uniref:hypothetical protein n=1 Tax=Chelativorans sp. ZYF759 TaxID=2692213 RepID=UPI00145F542F|nr:hypothetical protein [Chelativorans sp. ZYF759]NMG39212.1 hypothetical protein [Chelativorans sp. ZYF759]